MAVTSPSHTFTYDVFLNFRGTDTRHGFIGYLHKALHDSGIYAFIDDEDLQRGEEITPKLEEAIKNSRIAITVLSEDYASSSFCLRELSYILDCYSRKVLLVLPVFYKVSPSDVKYQNGIYKALAKNEERFLHNMVDWKNALGQVGNLSGFHFEQGAREYEHKFIRKIVQRVSSEINHGASRIHVADYPVGLGSQVPEISKLLDVGSDDDVHMIGIYGMGGVGKSTLARAVYNLITDKFDRSCFLQNVREESNKHGLKHLQSILLSQLLGKKEINLASDQQGTSMIQNRLNRKKVFIILDDVDEHKQLQGIVGRPDWFGPGSRVIITTRDKQLLASHGVKRTYEVKGMKENDALQLLTWKAFKTEEVDPSYEEVLNQVVTYASGLPLALEVIGSNLFGKSMKEWESAIKQYKRIPNNRILEMLKVSFDALGEEEKGVFLDVACCLKGYKWTDVEYILRVLYDHCMKYHIGVLVEKSLIKTTNGRVTLHDLVEDMGKSIDWQKSPKEPGRRRRLWVPKDIIQVLKDNTGTSEIEIICGNFPISDEEEKVEWNENAFKEMINLKILIVRNRNFSNLPNHLPRSLKVLKWQMRNPDFHPKNLP